MQRADRNFVGKGDSGFTLVEVLVAVLVLSIGIFGLIGLQSAALKNNQSAYLRSQATILIYDMADKMRSNMEVDYATVSAVSHATSCISVATPCNAATIAERDVYDWEQDISSILPSGAGSVSTASGITTVFVSWDDDRDSGTSAETFSMSFEL